MEARIETQPRCNRGVVYKSYLRWEARCERGALSLFDQILHPTNGYPNKGIPLHSISMAVLRWNQQRQTTTGWTWRFPTALPHMSQRPMGRIGVATLWERASSTIPATCPGGWVVPIRGFAPRVEFEKLVKIIVIPSRLFSSTYVISTLPLDKLLVCVTFFGISDPKI